MYTFLKWVQICFDVLGIGTGILATSTLLLFRSIVWEALLVSDTIPANLDGQIIARNRRRIFCVEKQYRTKLAKP